MSVRREDGCLGFFKPRPNLHSSSLYHWGEGKLDGRGHIIDWMSDCYGGEWTFIPV